MSALRSARQLAVSSSRALSARSFSSAARLPARNALATAAQVHARIGASAVRAFSMSAAARGEGATDGALSAKLQEELQYEKQAAEEAGTSVPDFLKAFKADGVWEIQDVAGNDEVTLVRKFGNESIRLMFSIADIQTNQEQEFDDLEKEEGEEDADEPIHSYPIRCSFSITKANGTGSLNIDAMCQEGTFIIDNLSFYPTAELGTELTAEADWKRRGLYIGPQFDTLDVGVQEEFERFLQERGINESLALFVPEYAEHKEQTEYVKWLGSVKKFIDA